MHQSTTSGTSSNTAHWWREPPLLLAIALVFVLYFGRLTVLPIRGEENTWATIAQEMIASGDWIVPRLQGDVFIDRPPLHSQMMGALGVLRGRVDLVAIRLPSVVAVLLTTVLIYAYGRSFLVPAGAFAAAVGFATMGQVLDLGRLGENEAVFTCLLSAALVSWHWLYLRDRRLSAWTVGYALAGLAALQKGIQGPVYLGAAATLYLASAREYRELFSWRHLLGLATFALVVGSWLVPFGLATNLESCVTMWTQTVTHRLGTSGLLKQIATYPLETFACLLPWSLIAPALLDRRVRVQLKESPAQVRFALIAILATYPTVWFAAEARGRYYMPLYPLFALLIAYLLQHCALAAEGSRPLVHWRRFLWAWAAVIPVLGVALLIASLLEHPAADQFRQPRAFAWLFAFVSLFTGLVLWRLSARASRQRLLLAVTTLAVFLAVAYNGAVINARSRSSLDLTERVAALKQELPQRGRFVSLGPVHPQFTYYYAQRIEPVAWPLTLEQADQDLEYFCFSYLPGDNEKERQSGRWYDQQTTPGTLPFEWEQVAFIPCGRRLEQDRDQVGVIIGRAVRRAGSLVASERRGHLRVSSGENSTNRH